MSANVIGRINPCGICFAGRATELLPVHDRHTNRVTLHAVCDPCYGAIWAVGPRYLARVHYGGEWGAQTVISSATFDDASMIAVAVTAFGRRN